MTGRIRTAEEVTGRTRVKMAGSRSSETRAVDSENHLVATEMKVERTKEDSANPSEIEEVVEDLVETVVEEVVVEVSEETVVEEVAVVSEETVVEVVAEDSEVIVVEEVAVDLVVIVVEEVVEDSVETAAVEDVVHSTNPSVETRRRGKTKKSLSTIKLACDFQFKFLNF